jgi:hypothetical protein
MLGVRVIGGVGETSRTLNTLMPNISLVPREKSSSFHLVGAGQLGAAVHLVDEFGIGVLGHLRLRG